MENFKEIAEKCLAGKLSGIFIFNNGENIHSTFLVHELQHALKLCGIDKEIVV